LLFHSKFNKEDNGRFLSRGIKDFCGCLRGSWVVGKQEWTDEEKYCKILVEK
jgi:hypothetical protein